MTTDPGADGAVRADRPVSLVSDVAAAFLLLTRIPVRWERFSSAPPDFGRSAWAQPVVGVAVGAIGAVAFGLGSLAGLPALAAALIAIAAQCLTTGAFHEDGLADVADGFGGAFDRERKLEIMKDSRVGTFGALALVLAVGLRGAAIADLSVALAAGGLVSAGAASRATILAIVRRLPSVRPGGLGALGSSPSSGRLVAAGFLGAMPALLLLGIGPGFLALLGAVAATAIVARIADRQIGGYTGDVLGAAQQAAEVAFLLTLAAAT